MTDEPISAEFPFESKTIEVLGARMHYVDHGTGDPILLLHGNPTSSYLWRNIIPHLAPHGRCIAPDLIGMGRSDKPNIDYRFFDHARYLDAFIDQLGLENVTLVIHDWGSGLGLHWARRNPKRVKAIAMMEAIVKPSRWNEFPPDFRFVFRLMRSPIGWLMISVMNGFVNKMLPQTIVRPLSDEEMQRYRAPFPTVGSRKPVRQWPREIPIDGRPADVHRAVATYSEWLKGADIPKLLLYATPGGIIDARTLTWCRENIEHLETVDVGRGIHFLQEDNPHGIGRAIAEWYVGLSASLAAAG